MSGVLAVNRSRRLVRLNRLAVSGAGGTLVTSVLIQLANAGTGIALARGLGPTHRGELALIVLVAWFVVVLGSLGVVEAAAYYGARPESDSGALLGTLAMLAATQTLGAVIVGAIAIRVVLSDSSPSVRAYGYAFLLFVPLNLAVQYLGAVLRAHRRFREFNVSRLLFTVASGVPIVAAAATGRLGIALPLFAYCIAGVMYIVYCIWALGDTPHLSFDGLLARRLVSYGLKSFTGSVSSLFNQQADQLVVGVFLGASQLGLYVVAATASSVIVLIGQSAALVALPTLASVVESDRRAHLANRFLLSSLAAACAAGVAGLIASRWVVPLMFGSSYRGAVACAEILFVAGIFLSTNRILGAVLRAENRPGAVGIAEGAALVITLVLLAALTPTYGIAGAAIASLVAYGVAAALMYGALWRFRASEFRPVT